MDVGKRNTPHSEAEMRRALADAGPELNDQQTAFLLAHTYLETAGWRSMFNDNVGNLSVDDRATPDVDFWRPPWFELGPDPSERNKRLHEAMLRGEAPRAFQAFPNLAAGAARFLARLRGPYRTMLEAATPREYVEQWKATGYTPDLNVEATDKTFSALVERFRTPGATPAAVPASSGGLSWAIGGASALFALWLFARTRARL